MTTYCETLQEKLAEEGAAALAADASAAAHVAGCPDCAAVLDALGQLDAALPHVARPDPSDELVERTLAAVREAAPGLRAVPRQAGLKAFLGGRLLRAAGVAAVLVGLTALTSNFLAYRDRSAQRRSMSELRSIESPLESSPGDHGRGGRGQVTGSADGPPPEPLPQAVPNETSTFSAVAGGAVPQNRTESSPEPVSVAHATPVGRSFGSTLMLAPGARPRPNRVAAERLDDRLEIKTPATALSRDLEQARVGAKQGEIAAGRFREGKLENERQAGTAGKPGELDALGYLGKTREKGQAELVAGLTRPSTLPLPSAPRPVGHEEALLVRGKDGDRDTREGEAYGQQASGDEVAADKKNQKNLQNKEDAEKRKAGTAGIDSNLNADPPELINALLGDRSSLSGLVFQDASGYWANTYVAGDAEMRFLAARLDHAAGGPRPERLARAYRQPFDRPAASALKVYLHADRGAVHGPTRLLVQVGIAATEQVGSARPPLNLGIVLDLRDGLDLERARAARALLVALAAGRRAGDRFSLTVAGRPGATLLGPDEFRAGRIQVALDGLLAAADAAPTPATAAVTLDLPAAMETALTAVAGASDPTATIGASAVLLVTAAPLGDSAETLVRMAHASAVNGIPVAAVSLGGETDPDSLDRLVLAGQGERHLLVAADGAPDLAERVLLGVSRTVARAVRLRIRLAPGVKLVDVLGSCRLDRIAADQVREAEKSVDQRLARALGIAADRGDDEEGIQIVIPAFHAGRDHVVLLDVVAERPGAIADVTVRYKDLVYLRNGVASARLALGGGEDVVGPLERNVVKNLIALRVSERLREAGSALADGDATSAAALLRDAQAQITALRARDTAFAADPELRADQALASEYLALLADPSRFAMLADSLELAALHKLVPAFTRAQGME